MAPLNKQPSAGAAVSSTGRRRWFCHQESHGSRPSVTLTRRGSAMLTKQQHTHRRWKLNYFGHYLGENTIITDASRFSMVMRLEECELSGRAKIGWSTDALLVDPHPCRRSSQLSFCWHTLVRTTGAKSFRFVLLLPGAAVRGGWLI